MTVKLQKLALITCLALLSFICFGADATPPSLPHYKINPGDVLSIEVWNEETLSLPQTLVRPDGNISLPIIGEVSAGGKSISELQDTISEALLAYVKDRPTVTVSTLQIAGNAVYIIGKVNRPGSYVMNRQLDVSQALALAGGLTAFADNNSIQILRRNEEGDQDAIRFRYNKIEKGNNLEENILLQSGDVIVVP